MASACGSYVPGDEELELSEAEEVGQLTQALNGDASCMTPALNYTVDGGFPQWPAARHVSPSVYGVQGCSNAYFVGIDDLQASLTDEKRDHVYPATMPTTQAECGRSRLMIYVWGRENARLQRPYQYVGSKNMWGQWVETPTGNFCAHWNYDIIAQFGLTGGGTNDYRLAVSVRRYAVAGDTGSSFWTEPIAFSKF